MRRSSMLIMLILLGGFGAILAAGGSVLQPLREDAEVSRELTRRFAARGDLAEGSRLRLNRLPATERRLAESGRGVLIVLSPSPALCVRKKGLRAVAVRSAREALAHFQGQRIEWVEVLLDLDPGAETPREIRTLLPVGDVGRLGEPTPPIPETVRPTPGA